MATHPLLRSYSLPFSGATALLGLALCVPIAIQSAIDLPTVLLYYLAGVGTALALVVKSRLHNRSSFWWSALASVGSNGMWFVGMYALATAEAPLPFLTLALLGALAGRTFGVWLAVRIETRHKLVASVAQDSASYDTYLRTGRWALPFMAGFTLAYIGWLAYAHATHVLPAIIVACLGLVQNLMYAQKTRLVQRGKDRPDTVLPLALLTIAANITFYLSFIYLLRHDMHPLLLVPYTAVTVLGSLMGIMASIARERRMQIGGDDHLEPTQAPAPPSQHVLGAWLTHNPRRIYGLVAGMAFTGAASVQMGIVLFGWNIAPVSVSLGATEVWWIAVGAIVTMILLKEVAFTLLTQAANRDHFGYHVSMITVVTLFDFLVSRTFVHNSTWALVPLGVGASTIGLLYARSLSVPIERWLNARMDVVTQKG